MGDRCPHEGAHHARASVIRSDDDAGDQPYVLVLVPRAAREQAGATGDRGEIAAPWATGAPADGLPAPLRQQPRGVALAAGQRLEASPVAAAVPPRGELPSGRAERGAPTVPGCA